ncbi:GntR family transcriptional regulator [Nonomuraea salmonea]|uniref:winged helix-turn-helix domain-containing protein n=1 Tax=Nonomuraea salmonea TaxID=46181 RepID=UPI0031E5FA4C
MAAEGTPISYRYEVIAAWLREAIKAGDLPPGAQVPSEAVLRRRFTASRTTVRQALAVLEREGLVAAAHGRGAVRPDMGQEDVPGRLTFSR